jgi:hypothetical protein
VGRGVLGAGRGLILDAANIGIFILAWRKSGAKDNAETLRRRGAQRARRSDTEFAEKGFLQRLKPGLWLAPTRGLKPPPPKERTKAGFSLRLPAAGRLGMTNLWGSMGCGTVETV